MEIVGKRIEEALASSGKNVFGEDSDGRSYDRITDMWSIELADTEDAGAARAKSRAASRTARGGAAARWYTDANKYWEDEENCPATVDGVLGGYGFISSTDVRTSTKFIKALRKQRPSFGSGRALDCGAGIGRVTKNLLLPLFSVVDLLEQSERLIGSAKAYIEAGVKGGTADAGKKTGCLGDRGSSSSAVAAAPGNVGELFCCGMQDHTPAPETYDVVWLQWVIGHLTDTDFVAFLQRCVAGLKPGGLLCIKDNVLGGKDAKGRAFLVDKDDSSMTRSDDYLKALFKAADLQIVGEATQKMFPKELFPVKMYALEAAPVPLPSPSSASSSAPSACAAGGAGAATPI